MVHWRGNWSLVCCTVTCYVSATGRIIQSTTWNAHWHCHNSSHNDKCLETRLVVQRWTVPLISAWYRCAPSQTCPSSVALGPATGPVPVHYAVASLPSIFPWTLWHQWWGYLCGRRILPHLAIQCLAERTKPWLTCKSATREQGEPIKVTVTRVQYTLIWNNSN